jgi:WD40 repeat protein
MLYYDLLSVKFLANGRFVTMGSHIGQVRIWDKHTGKIVQTLEHNRAYLLALRRC